VKAKAAGEPGASAEALFGYAFDYSTDMMVLMRVDAKGRIFVERANASALRFYEQVLPSLFPDHWRSRDLESAYREIARISEAQIEAMLAPHREAIRTGNTVSGTSEITDASGKRLLRRYEMRPLKDASDRVTQLFFCGSDLTELRRAAEHFENAFRISPIPIAITSEGDGRCLEANEAWLRFYGFRREQVLGRTTLELGLWVDQDERRKFVARMARRDDVRSFRMRSHVAGGRIAPCMLTGERIRWAGVDAVIASVYELTDPELARREAQEIGERFSRLFEVCPVPLSIVRSSDSVRVQANAAWLAFHGRTRGDALGRSANENPVWADDAERIGMVEAFRRDGRVPGRLVKLIGAGGMVRSAYVAMEPILWEGEDCALASTLDVGDLEQARHEAEILSERFTALFRLSPNPSSVTAVADGRYLAVNEAWARAIGYSPEEMLGRTSVELGLWESPEARAAFARNVGEASGVSHHQARFRTRGGELREIFMSTDRIEWEGEAAILSSMNDVTDLSRALQEIRHLNESLEQKVQDRTGELQSALREIEAFSYTVSHDLRAPLRHVSGFAGLLLERPSVRGDPEAADYAARLGAAAKRLGGMVDSLLEYSRLGRKQISPAEVDLGAETKLIVAELSTQAGARRVRWDIGALPLVQGDPTLLRLLMQNLLDNALKYTRRREDAVIDVGARRDGANWVVHVRDNGVGFDMRFTSKLFGVFQRLHGEREFEGTGIGLAHAARIVERHGGRIWCDAAVDKGASFYFTLPADARAG
jgi:PAS domain S-box-containing protein